MSKNDDGPPPKVKIVGICTHNSRLYVATEEGVYRMDGEGQFTKLAFVPPLDSK